MSLSFYSFFTTTKDDPFMWFARTYSYFPFLPYFCFEDKWTVISLSLLYFFTFFCIFRIDCGTVLNKQTAKSELTWRSHLRWSVSELLCSFHESQLQQLNTALTQPSHSQYIHMVRQCACRCRSICSAPTCECECVCVHYCVSTESLTVVVSCVSFGFVFSFGDRLRLSG